MQGIIVSPIRDPMATWATWVRAQRGPPYTGVVDFIYAWTRLNEVYLNRQDFYLVPVDSKNRDEYLARLSDRLGVELTTDWSRVNSNPGDQVEARFEATDLYQLDVVRDVYR